MCLFNEGVSRDKYKSRGKNVIFDNYDDEEN